MWHFSYVFVSRKREEESEVENEAGSHRKAEKGSETPAVISERVKVVG
jgi:hypothetical protein